MRPTRPRPARHPVLLALGVVLAVCGFIASTPGIADAHVVYKRTHTYKSGTDCAAGYAEVSHGSTNGGYYKSNVTAEFMGQTVDGRPDFCRDRWSRPRNGLYTHIFGDKYLGGGKWGKCWGSNKAYNTRQVSSLTLYVADTDGVPGCGRGYYGSDASIYIRNGSLHGGHMWSGDHYLPA